jgi:DNA-binding transcriptional ArsR family regulator
VSARQKITDEQLCGAIRRHAIETEQDWVSTGWLVSYLGITRGRVYERLSYLLALGVVEKRGQRRGTNYRLTDREMNGTALPIAVDREPMRHPAELSPLRPVGKALRDKVESMLRRDAFRPMEIAKSLVVPFAEVTAAIESLKQMGEEGLGPKILRRTTGAYYIEAEAKATEHIPGRARPRGYLTAPQISPRRAVLT